jgi:phosphoribosylformimino-5-aminoimidazole carboxamide ribotide isomerase
MRIIPVMDIKDGIVVHAVAGQRDRYTAVHSILCKDARPASVAAALVDRFGFREIYLADLDAISGQPPNWDAYDAVAGLDVQLLLDAGIRDLRSARPIVEYAARLPTQPRVVVALESLASAESLPELIDAISSQNAVFSVDLQDGRLLTHEPKWQSSHVLSVVDDVVAAGFRHLILLDLATVGTGRGWKLAEKCRAIRARHPTVEIISGGGVQTAADLIELGENGCDAALVATALHTGRITAADLKP